MTSQNLLAHPVGVDVAVNLSGGDACMAQHGLDGAKAGATSEQMGGKGVAEGMRTDCLADTGGFGLHLDDVKHRDA